MTSIREEPAEVRYTNTDIREKWPKSTETETFYPMPDILFTSHSFWSFWCHSSAEQWTKHTGSCFPGKMASHSQQLSLISSSSGMHYWFLHLPMLQKASIFHWKFKISHYTPWRTVFPALYHFLLWLALLTLPCRRGRGQASWCAQSLAIFSTWCSHLAHQWLWDTTVCLWATAWPSLTYGNLFAVFCKWYLNSNY